MTIKDWPMCIVQTICEELEENEFDKSKRNENARLLPVPGFHKGQVDKAENDIPMQKKHVMSSLSQKAGQS